MRRRRARGEVSVAFPRLAPGLTRAEWLAAMRTDWADQHVEGSERWAVAQAAIDEIEAFEVPADRATEIIRAAGAPDRTSTPW